MRSAEVKPILLTGGAGFIGSNFILQWLADERTPIINLDKLIYAGNPANLSAITAPAMIVGTPSMRVKLSAR
jgi:dTDP-D-glucose 4,6-dehydratase